jgi:hypothetical protein
MNHKKFPYLHGNKSWLRGLWREAGDAISVANAGNDGISDRGEAVSKSPNKCDWFFTLLDILLSVMGIRYVKINIFKNKP